MRHLLLAVLLAGSAQAGGIIQGGAPPSPLGGPSTFTVVNASTVTITGTGAKCFSVDDPTLVVDCGLNKVTVGGSAGLEVTYGLTAATGSFSGSLTASSVTAQTATLGNGTLAVPAIVGTDADSGVMFGGSGFSAKSLVYVRDGSGMWYFDNNELQYAGATAPARIDAQTRMRIYSSVSSVALSTSATDGADNLRVNADGSLVINPQGQGSVGIGTASPATTLDVNGSAQFGSGATKSTFTTTGALSMAAGASIFTGPDTPYPGAVAQTGYGNIFVQGKPLTAGQTGGQIFFDDRTTSGTNTLGMRVGLSGNVQDAIEIGGNAATVPSGVILAYGSDTVNKLALGGANFAPSGNVEIRGAKQGMDPTLFIMRVSSANGTAIMDVKASGSVGIGTASPCSTCTLHVAGGASVRTISVDTTETPASNAACSAGKITWDANYLYVCTASAVWKRSALTGGY